MLAGQLFLIEFGGEEERERVLLLLLKHQRTHSKIWSGTCPRHHNQPAPNRHFNPTWSTNTANEKSFCLEHVLENTALVQAQSTFKFSCLRLVRSIKSQPESF